ncbi:MAG: DUF1572 family protein [Bacteroidota bacterium]
MTPFEKSYLTSARAELTRYKTMAEKTFAQVDDEELFWRQSESDNSIAFIAKHIVGNMRSRWTNFFTEDGEKTWRNRDTEFEGPYANRQEMLDAWHGAWDILFSILDSIDENNYNQTVKIRGEAHSIPAALNRQLAHYASHVGQIVFLGKMLKGESWTSLSIPKGKSDAFNAAMFKPKS